MCLINSSYSQSEIYKLFPGILFACFVLSNLSNINIHMKNSDAKASKCRLKCSSEISIFIRLMNVQLFHFINCH